MLTAVGETHQEEGAGVEEWRGGRVKEEGREIEREKKQRGEYGDH